MATKPNAFGNMSDTLRGYAGPEPVAANPIQQAADHLRVRGTPADPAFHGDGRYGAPPNPSTTGATNATAGATTAQVPNGNPGVAGQQMGAGSTVPSGGGAAGTPGGATAGQTGRVASALRSASNFATGAGESAGSVTGAFKAVGTPVLNAGKALLNAGGQFAAPATLGAAAYQGFNTDTEDYAKRFGLENTEPGALRDVGVRSLGVASDVGNNMLLGVPQMLGAFRDKNEPAAPAPATPTAPTRIPFDQLPQATYSNEGRNYPAGAPPREQFAGQKAQDVQLATDLRNPMSNASLQKVNPGGQVQKVVGPDGRVTYSGGNVSGLVSLTDANGKALPGQMGGGIVQGTGDGTQRFARPQAATATDPLRAQQAAMAQFNAAQEHADRTYGIGATRRAYVEGARQVMADTLRNQSDMQRAQMQDATSRRGQDLTLEAAGMPKRLELEMQERKRQVMQQAIAAATPRGADGKPTGEVDRTLVQQYLADAGFGDMAEAQSKLVGNVQAQAEKTGKLHTDARERLAALVSVPVLDENGKPTGKADAPREKDVVSRIMATRKDLANADQPTINAAVPALAAEITATDKINQGVADQGFGFRGSFMPSYNRQEGGPSTPRGAEWFKGKTLTNKGAGFWNGWGSDGTNYTLRDSDGFWGTEHDLGHLTAEEIAHIGKQIDASKQLRK